MFGGRPGMAAQAKMEPQVSQPHRRAATRGMC